MLRVWKYCASRNSRYVALTCLYFNTVVWKTLFWIPFNQNWFLWSWKLKTNFMWLILKTWTLIFKNIFELWTQFSYTQLHWASQSKCLCFLKPDKHWQYCPKFCVFFCIVNWSRFKCGIPSGYFWPGTRGSHWTAMETSCIYYVFVVLDLFTFPVGYFKAKLRKRK